MMTPLKKILYALAWLALGAVLGQALPAWRTPPPAGPPAAPAAEPAMAERKILYWYDPMYPGEHFDQPGPSPFMDMALLPRYADDDEGAGIRIDPAQTQNLAVRTEKAKRGVLTFTRDIPANVAFNDYQLAKVQPRAEGFVEKTYSLAVGDVVPAGAPLVDVTVPGWASDQSEYLLLKSQKAEPRIINGVLERMRLTGLPEEMLARLEALGQVQTRMTIHAPIGGVITSFDVYPGMNVDKNMTIAAIQGIDPIWATADVPERDLHLAASSRRIRVTTPAWPDRVFYAESFVLLPQVDPETRTASLRLSLDNSEGLLRPGLTASVRLRASGEEALIIPTRSLIDLGDEQRVVTRTADGGFVPKKVRALRSSGEQTALASGLEDGDEVVVSGLFLIDSEANLRGALDRMRADEAPPQEVEQ